MKDTKNIFADGFVPFEKLSALAPDTPFLIALSGGGDSRMLFELAARHCRLHSSHFYACHVNHGIRGDEAIRDRDFCKALADSCRECADIFILDADVPTLAAESGMSIEQCARQVRYEFFDRIMKENGIRILVTAHNADDLLETLVFNMARGSGARGMCGIPLTRPVENGILIRPMLGITKSDILDFCRYNGLEYVTDSTNAQTEYTRNLIRAEIVPLLEKINPSVRGSALRLADSMNELWSMTADNARAYLSEDGSLPLSPLSKADPRLVPYVLALAADAAGAELEGVHIDALRSLAANRKDGSSLSLPGGKRAVIVNDTLFFEDDRQNAPLPFAPLPLSEGVTELPFGRITAEFTDSGVILDLSLSYPQENSCKNINVYKLDIKTLILFDKIKCDPCDAVLRPRRAGDRILSGGLHKSVKKLMCDKKVPRFLRDQLPLLTVGDEILWIPSVADADLIKTKKI